nr:MAG TPA: hypothetical protein [Caudoviricetes sp.]
MTPSRWSDSNVSPAARLRAWCVQTGRRVLCDAFPGMSR